MATVKVTREMAEKAASDIDWAKLDAMTDDDIARQIAENPDAAPDLTKERAKVVFLVHSSRVKARHKFRLVRRALGLSQAQFARAYHISPRTLQNWEQGTREPDEHALSLLKLIAHEPERTKQILNEG